MVNRGVVVRLAPSTILTIRSARRDGGSTLLKGSYPPCPDKLCNQVYQVKDLLDLQTWTSLTGPSCSSSSFNASNLVGSEYRLSEQIEWCQVGAGERSLRQSNERN